MLEGEDVIFLKLGTAVKIYTQYEIFEEEIQ
jgi:hypothetical protein